MQSSQCCCIVLLVCLSVAGCVFLTVPSYGTLKGTIGLSAYTRRLFHSYRSVYYAEKPTPETRFLPPVPKAPYPKNEIVLALLDNAGCPQPTGDENCLSLNVFTPKVHNGPFNIFNRRLLPVVVWFHGGMNSGGKASQYIPNRFMEEDVVLVVPQYRLNILGFLSFQSDDAPGNAAIFDQIEALRWVNKHIAAFGGDPSLVTIAGESAGAWDVTLLLLARQAKGLFHRVIAESGTIDSPYAVLTPDANEAASVQIAQMAGCPASPYDELLYCVRHIDAGKLSAAYFQYAALERLHDKSLGLGGSSPIVQNYGAQRIIEVPPSQLFSSGQFTQVPILMGTNKDEGSYVLAYLYEKFLLPNKLADNSTYLANDLIPAIIKLFGIPDDSGETATAYAKQYLAVETLGNFKSMIPGLINLCSVVFVKEPVYNTVLTISQYLPTSTYMYSFNFRGRFSLFTIFFESFPLPANLSHGVSHGDELIYLYNFDLVFLQPLNSTEVVLSKKMLRVWTDFMKYGQPTRSSRYHNLFGIRTSVPSFPPFTASSGRYMAIDSEWVVKTDFPATYTGSA